MPSFFSTPMANLTIPEEKFNRNSSEHLMLMTKRIAAFKQQFSQQLYIDRVIASCMATLTVCMGVGTLLFEFPFIPLAKMALAGLVYFAGRRHEVSTSYNQELENLKSLYQWSMRDVTASDVYYNLRNNTVFDLIKTLGPLVGLDFIKVWKETDFNAGYFGSEAVAITGAKLQFLQELEAGNLTLDWQPYLLGGMTVSELMTKAHESLEGVKTHAKNAAAQAAADSLKNK